MLVGAVVALTVAFVAVNVRPGLWFVDTTPTGGDLGAHVWGPAYLRDVLLPEWRLTGWTHDWYAGFPAFTFYMVVPSLLVVIVDVGLDVDVSIFAALAVGAATAAVVRARQLRLPIVALLGAVAAGAVMFVDGVETQRALAVLLLPAACAWWAWHATLRWPRWRVVAAVAACASALLAVPMPYGVSLKLVAIAGVVGLPVAVWAMTRLGGVGAEGQALAVLATLLFLFDRSFNIYGGNLMSTMAGEFAYSLGLACAVVFIGVAAKGMDRGRHRLLGGALLALTGLMHLFSAFFALAVLAALLLVSRWRAAAWRRRLWWTVCAGALSAGLSAWWVLPFWWNRGLLNDMGWGKERRYLSSLWSRSSFDYSFLANDPPLQVFVVVAAAAAVLLWWRRSRLGMATALTAVMVAVAFVILPEGRLWNVRILPFYYLAVYLTAALGLGEAITAVRHRLERARAERAETAKPVVSVESVESVEPVESVGSGRVLGRLRGAAGSVAPGAAVALAGAAVIVAVGLPLRSLPAGRLGDDQVYRWGPFSSSQFNLGPYWVEHNFEGYERKQPNADGGGASEYQDLVDTMSRVGETRGCGPALWEYEAAKLGSYGTPMAPMLLPHWTDRCIASMEGLYFEASATTPYHFLMQSELSARPSRAQRDLPYSSLDVASGVDHLQLMGVRYYLAFSPEAVQQARDEPRLVEVDAGGIGGWVVFEVTGSAGVEGLSRLPVVVDGLDASGDSWIEAAVGAFGVAGKDGPLLAADGPPGWPGMTLDDPRDGAELDRSEVMRRLSQVIEDSAPDVRIEPTLVSDIVRDNHSVAFSVDRVGAPVLVRTSYFPNWTTTGALGPWRVTPNLMVVVPTDTDVRLDFGRSAVERFAAAVTLLSLLVVAWSVVHSVQRRDAPTGAAPSQTETPLRSAPTASPNRAVAADGPAGRGDGAAARIGPS